MLINVVFRINNIKPVKNSININQNTIIWEYKKIKRKKSLKIKKKFVRIIKNK